MFTDRYQRTEVQCKRGKKWTEKEEFMYRDKKNVENEMMCDYNGKAIPLQAWTGPERP